LLLSIVISKFIFNYKVLSTKFYLNKTGDSVVIVCAVT